MRRLISFDIDGTLETGEPPGLIPMELVRRVKEMGWLIGSCSDRPVSAQRQMWELNRISVDFAVTKTQLGPVRQQWEADFYVHIGDTDIDRYYAGEAGFEFVHVDEILNQAWWMALASIETPP